MTSISEKLMDLCLASEGVLSYSEVKNMSARELEVVANRLSKHLEAKAKAMRKASKG